MTLYSIYLHIPFCVHRCGYCDFNTYAGLQNLIPSYVEALCCEARIIHQALGQRLDVQTVFFGGGTPSFLPLQAIERILDTLAQCFSLLPDSEISLEANPGTVSLEYLQGLFASGVNRLSLGMQTANPSELQLLERQHDYLDVIHAVTWARKAGFSNLNLDLIFGLPGQDLASWQRNLALALQLNPEHLALYALTVEHGTPLGTWTRRGLLSEPDADLAAGMYETASETLVQNGYTQYEISNWARHISQPPLSAVDNPALACKHNLQYWHNLPYIGLGAGAHGYAGGIRTANVLSPSSYIQRLQQSLGEGSSSNNLGFPHTPATQNANSINTEEEIGETMMMGLRLTREGVSQETFQNRFQRSLSATFSKQIERLLKLGLLEWKRGGQTHLRLTERGRLLGNQVFVEFI